MVYYTDGNSVFGVFKEPHTRYYFTYSNGLNGYNDVGNPRSRHWSQTFVKKNQCIPPVTTKADAERELKKIAVKLHWKVISNNRPCKQTGKSGKRDSTRKAKEPGWRESKSGKWYFENRKNRSDSDNELKQYNKRR